jgi:tellurite resistance protein TerC
MVLFPFAEYWGIYAGFVLFVLLVLSLDLGVFHKNAHEVGTKEALIWSAIWIGLALTFNLLLYFYSEWKFSEDKFLMSLPGFNPSVAAKQAALEFLTGYIIEKSLSIDNIFVFVIVFNFFAIPAKHQHRVLFYGIIGALLFRIIFISLGSVLMEYKIIVIVFGIFLMLTGIKILFAPDKKINPDKNPIIKFLKKIIPITNGFVEDKFFLKQNGIIYGTPLLVALVFIEFTDVIFAVDSVPAIFAVTKEPLLVFTSNIFAILGLRAMFFLLADIMHRFRFLKYGLGIILLFVGLKMAYLNELFGGKFPILLSLLIIGIILGASILLSLFYRAKIESK